MLQKHVSQQPGFYPALKKREHLMKRFGISPFLIALCLAMPVSAQDINDAAKKNVTFSSIDANTDIGQRVELAEALVASKESPGREFSADYRAALIYSLQQESLEQLQERERTGNIAPTALGDQQQDLTFTPLEPCRIFD